MKTNPSSHSPQFSLHLLFLVLLGVLLFAGYAGGLNSLFLFDDMPNLEALSQIQNAELFSASFFEFVLGGEAGPTGRPVSLFTFAMQASAWPDAPFQFKLINLAIHFLNSVLVYVLVRQISKLTDLNPDQQVILSISVAAIWAIHPVQTSTVLYTIQRMTLLSNFFILVGVNLHIFLRSALANTALLKKWIFLTSAFLFSGLAATFSKENGGTLLFYIFALEYTLLYRFNADSFIKKWRLVCLWLPTLCLIVVGILSWSYFSNQYSESYTFSAYERLLTQSRLLWKYLQTIILPFSNNTGLFFEFEISKSPLTPITTTIAIAAWLLIIFYAFKKRNTQPVMAFAIFWFLAGHAIESSIIPLELYFNHRNYLAFFGPLLAAIYFLIRYGSKINFQKVSLPISVLALLGLLLFFQLFLTTATWKNSLVLASTWYSTNPEAARNQEFLAIELANNSPQGAMTAAEIYDSAIAKTPQEFRLVLNRSLLSCINSELKPIEQTTFLEYLQIADPRSRDLFSPLQDLITLILNNQCQAFSIEFIELLIDDIYEKLSIYEQGLLDFEKIKIANFKGENENLLPLYESAYEKSRDAGVLYNKAVYLANQAKYAEALQAVSMAIKQVALKNNIKTGTREMKLKALYSLQDFLQNPDLQNTEFQNAE